MKRFRVGLTGGIAAGKSTVADWLRRAGFTVVDADKLVATLYQPGGEGAAAVARLFGSSFLTAEGRVDHQLLADKVFRDPAARDRLQQAIYPLVRRDFEAFADDASGVVVLEAPLLIEAGWAPDFDLVVTIEAPPEMRIRRAVDRGLSASAADARVAAQSQESVRVQAADRVLRNNGSLDALRAQVDDLVEEIEKRIANDD